MEGWPLESKFVWGDKVAIKHLCQRLSESGGLACSWWSSRSFRGKVPQPAIDDSHKLQAFTWIEENVHQTVDLKGSSPYLGPHTVAQSCPPSSHVVILHIKLGFSAIATIIGWRNDFCQERTARLLRGGSSNLHHDGPGNTGIRCLCT